MTLATFYGVTRSPREAERLMEVAMDVWMAGFVTMLVLIASMLGLQMGANPSLRNDLKGSDWSRERSRILFAQRRSPRILHRMIADCWLLYLWVFAAMLMLFVPAAATVATCGC